MSRVRFYQDGFLEAVQRLESIGCKCTTGPSPTKAGGSATLRGPDGQGLWLIAGLYSAANLSGPDAMRLVSLAWPEPDNA